VSNCFVGEPTVVLELVSPMKTMPVVAPQGAAT